MEAEENGANNELLYLSAWSIMRKAYKAREYRIFRVERIKRKSSKKAIGCE